MKTKEKVYVLKDDDELTLTGKQLKELKKKIIDEERKKRTMKPKIFTTSMNRKVCWEDGYKEGLHISIEISDGKGMTIINEKDFDRAIIDLINEREWHNYSLKEEMIKKIKQYNRKKK
jgi:hypothetical protein